MPLWVQFDHTVIGRMLSRCNKALISADLTVFSLA